MKKILSLILSLAGMFCCSNVAATEGDIIDIVFKGSTATVSIPAYARVTATINGANVTLTSTTEKEEYVYRLSGSTTDGSLVINGKYKLTLQLNGVSITSTYGAAIDVECGKRIAVEIVKGTTNTLVDGTVGAQKAAFYFKGHPEFEGEGTLNVTGRVGHAISAKEYLQLKQSLGTINILSAVKDGIHCGKDEINSENCYFQISGGVVNINNVGGDCIDTGDYGVMYIKGGSINANVTTAEATGLKSDSIIYMSAGELNISVMAQKAEGIRTNYDALFTGGTVRVNVGANGAKAIKSKCMTKSSAPVKNGGMLHFDGTEFELNVYGNDIKDDGVVTTNCRAVSADADITRSAGTIEIFAYGDIENAYNTDTKEIVKGGEFNLHRAPWNFYYGNYALDMTAYVSLQINGKPASLSDYAIGAFIGLSCTGVAIDDYLRIYSNESASYDITWKAYEYATGKVYDLYTNHVWFSQGHKWGSPTSPLVLHGLKGDINRDNKVDNKDVEALRDIILGLRSDTYGNADINGDHKISIADITALINVLP